MKDGEQEAASLAGTGLSAGHEITAVDDDGDRVLLDRCGNLVAGQLNVGEQVGIQRRIAEGQDRLRHIMARGGNRDIVVLLEVDAGVLLARVVRGAEEVPLHAGVGGTDDVLAVHPPTFATATAAADSTTTAASASVRATVRVTVESAAAAAAAALATAPALGLRSLIVTAGPVATIGTGVEVVVASRVLVSHAVKIGMPCGHDLPSPSAVVEAADGTGTGLRARRAIHGAVGGRTVGATAHLASHVGRDVGTGSGLLASELGSRRSRVEGQIAHATAELIRHVCGCQRVGLDGCSNLLGRGLLVGIFLDSRKERCAQMRVFREK